eukprot:6266585-Pyramimonas_sp.AAC.2
MQGALWGCCNGCDVERLRGRGGGRAIRCRAQFLRAAAQALYGRSLMRGVGESTFAFTQILGG